MANGYGDSSSSSSSSSSSKRNLSGSLKRTYVFSGKTETAPTGYHYMSDGSLMSDLEHIEKFGGKKPEIKQQYKDDDEDEENKEDDDDGETRRGPKMTKQTPAA